MRKHLLYLVVAVPAAGVGWAGCSPSRTSWQNDTPTFVSDAGTLPLPDAGCTTVVCSRDLRSVRDCSDNVVKNCSSDQGCANGDCLPACEAAARNEGSVGCSFLVPTPHAARPESCAAFFVANNWTSPATIHIEFKGQELPLDGAVWVPYVEGGTVKHKKLEGPIPPGSGAVVFLSNERPVDLVNWVTCPAGVHPVLDKAPGVSKTGFGSSPIVTTDVPVSMYSIYPYGGANSYSPSATLLLPTTSLRKNYIVASAWGGKGYSAGRGLGSGNAALEQPGMPTLQIVAIEDDTSVDLLPTVDITGGNGVPQNARKTVASYTLKRGEAVQFVQNSELTGSVLESTKPVAVFGGQTCMYVPSDTPDCDADTSQIPPLSTWGSEYAVVSAPNRSELFSKGTQQARDPSMTRFVGAVDGTELVYEPYQPEGAPNTLQSGELAAVVTYEPFVVRSQDAAHPFFVMNLMSGAVAAGTFLGDPEAVVTVPTAQWLDDYVFFSDSTYPYSAAVVTRRKVGGVFQDIDLDCAGLLTDWKPISADFEWTFVEFSRAFKPQSYPGGTCTDGPHRMHSDAPFALHVWGLGAAASYEYAGGTGLRPVTEVHVPVVVH